MEVSIFWSCEACQKSSFYPEYGRDGLCNEKKSQRVYVIPDQEPCEYFISACPNSQEVSIYADRY